MSLIYLDHNASTPLAPEVAAAIRTQVATLLGCAADEIVFTSGGSEANNLALKDVFYARTNLPAHIITSAVEHPSILWPSNNEVGTIEPIEACARIAREQGVPFHADAAPSVGKIPTSVDDLGVDFLSIAGHKLYAPKGVGALSMRRGARIEPLIHGAGHESGRRAGTASALLAAGPGAACVLGRDLAWTARVQSVSVSADRRAATRLTKQSNE
jgi:cysteine desulfurase